MTRWFRTPSQRAWPQCGWGGEPDVFLQALLKAKWIIQQGADFVIEGWERHGGRVLHDRLRKRKDWHADGKPTRKTNNSPADLPEVPGSTPEPPADLPEVPGSTPDGGRNLLLEHEHEHEQTNNDDVVVVRSRMRDEKRIPAGGLAGLLRPVMSRPMMTPKQLHKAQAMEPFTGAEIDRALTICREQEPGRQRFNYGLVLAVIDAQRRTPKAVSLPARKRSSPTDVREKWRSLVPAEYRDQITTSDARWLEARAPTPAELHAAVAAVREQGLDNWSDVESALMDSKRRKEKTNGTAQGAS